MWKIFKKKTPTQFHDFLDGNGPVPSHQHPWGGELDELDIRESLNSLNE